MAILAISMVFLLGAATIAKSETVAVDILGGKKISGEFFPRPVYGVNTNFFRSPEHLEDTRLWNLLDDLHMLLIRFPGGLANWYDWRDGSIKTAGREALHFMEKNDFRKIPLVRMLAAAKPYSIVYTLNPHDSDRHIVALTSLLLRSGTDVKGIEIGNEVYTKSLSDEIGGPHGYLSKARNASNLLKKGGYRGPVGINLAPEWMPGQEKHVHQRHWREWNLALRKDGLAGFDAVIVHYYPFVKNLGFSEAVRRGPLDFKRMIADIRKRFPGKQIWVTEWNLGQPVSVREFNSLHHAIFIMRMNAAFLETGIDMACYHVLTGRGWELIGPDRFTLDYRQSPESKMIRRVPYFAFQLFNEGFRNAATYQTGGEKELEYVILSAANRISVIGWTTEKQHFRLQLKNAGDFRFTGSEGMQSHDLKSTNGSISRWKEEAPNLPWKENVVLKTLDKPEFHGPGIFRFDYTLPNSGSKSNGK